MINFFAPFKIECQGTILAIGEANSRITFTSAFPDDFSYDDVPNGWRGIEFINTSTLQDSSLFRFCNFENSKAIQEDLRGGVIRIRNYSKILIENCLFTENYARFGGAIAFLTNSNPIFRNNVLLRNKAEIGGSAIYNYYSYPQIYLNTVVNNSVLNEEEFTASGAVQNYLAKPTFIGNIVHSNISNYYESDEVMLSKAFYTSYNFVEGGISGVSNSSSNPNFYVINNLPIGVDQDSSCLDYIGVNNLVNCGQKDFLGNPRIFDGNNDGLAKIDVGALEFDGVTGVPETVNEANREPKFTVYPVPFSQKDKKSVLQINYDFKQHIRDNTTISISLFNLQGKKLNESSTIVTTKSGSFPVSIVNSRNKKLASGVYFFKIKALQENYYYKFLVYE